jgi:ankyrin repeat protein
MTPDQQLWQAICAGNLEQTVKAVNAGANIHDSKSRHIRHAIWLKRLDILSYLINVGVELNENKHWIGLPLHIAVRINFSDAVEALIAGGVNIGKDTSTENYFLSVAAKIGNIDIVKALVTAGSDWTYKNYRPLRRAVKKSNLNVINYLKWIDSIKGDNPSRHLAMAMREERWDDAITAIKAGAEANVIGGLPLKIAAKNGKTKIVKLLLKKGADPNISDGSPLQLAIRSGFLSVIKTLIQGGADPNIGNPLLLQDAIRWAKIGGCNTVVDYLRSLK